MRKRDLKDIVYDVDGDAGSIGGAFISNPARALYGINITVIERYMGKMAKKRSKRAVPRKRHDIEGDTGLVRAPQDKEVGSKANMIKSDQVIGLMSWINTTIHGLIEYRWWKELIGIAIILVIAFSVRFEDLWDWKKSPQIAMYKGEPILTTFDGYYYLTYARDIAEGHYGKVDYRRGVPDYPACPSPPPLLSVFGAIAHKITGASFNWIGAVLPIFLGMLLVIPLYLMARYYGGPIMALSAILMATLSHYYLYRSSLGWFDTDCMHLTWAVSTAYLFMMFGVTEGLRRYIYCLLGFIMTLLFMWWWDQAVVIATALALTPFGVAILFFYRPTKKDILIFSGIIGCFTVIIMLWKGVSFPFQIISGVLSQLKYIAKDTTNTGFPNLGITISEQARPSFNEVIQKTSGSKATFFLSLLGLGLLFYKRPKESLFLSVPLILASFSFFFAKRFLIFMSPVTAMGIGYLVYFLWTMGRKLALLRVASIGLLIFLAYPAYQKAMAKNFWPKEPPHLIDGMVFAKDALPDDAVIWAWWDHGYPIIYWSNKGTVNDGGIHGDERSVYNGIPLAAHDQRFSANFMRFFVARGQRGIGKLYKALDGDKDRGMKFMKKVLTVGPKAALEIIKDANLKPVDKLKSPSDWLEFFFPKEARPVYLYLDWRLTVTSYWWFWLGTWDIAKQDGIHPSYKTFYNLSRRGDRIKGNGMEVDMEKGLLRFKNRLIPLKSIFIITRKGPITKQYNHKTDAQFEAFLPAGFGALMDKNIADSIFNKLYLRHLYNPKYFKPIRLMTPSHQIWEVKGEIYDAAAKAN